MILENIKDVERWLNITPNFSDYAKIKTNCGGKRIAISIPREYTRVIALLDSLVVPIDGGSFEGALINVSDFTVWSEVATLMLFNRVRRSHGGEKADLNEYSSTIFSPTEFDDFYACALLVLLGNWDADIGIKNGNCVLNAIHDGFCELTTPDLATLEEVKNRLGIRKIQYREVKRE